MKQNAVILQFLRSFIQHHSVTKILVYLQLLLEL